MMHRARHVLPFLFLCLAFSSARAVEGPFVGVNLGVAEPTADNYRAHVQTGGSGAPFAGYMFNDYLGLEGQLQFTFQEPDNDHRRAIQSNIDNENQTTTTIGATVGPRLQIPLGQLLDFYVTGQGGGFKGLSGRLNQWAPGFSIGGGLDVNVTRNFAVGLFGQWTRAYMAPHPTFLVHESGGEQGPEDAHWVTAGLSLTYSFAQPPPPPPPPPPPVKAQAPAPPPPVKKKIVLRSVHFDFDKANIRADARPVLDEAERTLKEEKDIELVIVEGHTDGVGSEGYNMKLSRRRAEAVRGYLVDHGIAPSRIRAEGFGKSRPVASNDTAEGRAQNRRVELHIE